MGVRRDAWLQNRNPTLPFIYPIASHFIYCIKCSCFSLAHSFIHSISHISVVKVDIILRISQCRQWSSDIPSRLSKHTFTQDPTTQAHKTKKKEDPEQLNLANLIVIASGLYIYISAQASKRQNGGGPDPNICRADQS